MPELIDLTGKQINEWEVIKRAPNRGKYIMWECKCKCGSIKIVQACHLHSKKTHSCRKCSEHKHKGKLNSSIFQRIKWGAKCRGIEFNLSKEYLYDLLYNKQQQRCVYLDEVITIANTIYGCKHGEGTASLDRIDSSKPYEEGNVQWVHKKINLMKGKIPHEEFLSICRKVAQNVRSNQELV